jgi:2-methylisocitrate lyase-like PEP mutase family enzyme
VNSGAGAALRRLLARERITVAPGAYDALTALLVARAGFELVYLSGAGVAYAHLARPDVGLTTPDEIVTRGRAMVEAVDVPILADGDTGFGNALNVQRTVRAYEAAGLAGIQLEDQVFPKRCGHLAGKEVVPAAEMVGKIRAACDARRDHDFVIVARTDAIATHGITEATDRLGRYAEAGADVIFADGPRSDDELRAIPRAAMRPAMANMVEGGATPLQDAAALEAMGYRIVIFPNALLRLLVRQGAAFLAALRADGTTARQLANIASFGDLQRFLGTDELLARGDAYRGEA